MAKTVEAYESHTIVLSRREPGDEDYDDEVIAYLDNQELAEELLRKVSPHGKPGDLGEPYCYLSVGTSLVKDPPFDTLEAAETFLRKELNDRHDAEGNNIGKMLKAGLNLKSCINPPKNVKFVNVIFTESISKVVILQGLI